MGWSFIPTFQSFICHAYSARKSSLRSWIKRFPWRSRAHQHFVKHFHAKPARVAQPGFSSSSHPKCPLLVLQDYYQGTLFFCSSSFSPAWWKNSLSVQKKVLVWFSAGPKPPLPAFSKNHHSAAPPCPSRFLSGKNHLHSPVLAWKVCVALKYH